ncbi:asparagine synthetase B [Jiangella sp. DSM 45060]|uniref:asparagine synthetase B family protein n=1 Tax=Jiangella sp. DSM 45060 TaxID=1798224 RepID=UPI000AE8204E|nr:asparagine synthase-related protein [Jiangella sp. DSM 45060]
MRDRFGVEALYYYPLDDGVVFGSDPSALFSHDRVRRQVDLKSMRDIFTFTTPRHTSPWRNLFQVEPGGTVTVTADGVRSRPYWRLATRTHTDDRQATVAHVRERLTTVLRQQLSDMAPCIMLSGGLDSSAMVGIAATQLDGAETLHTFSVDFADPAGGAMDAPFARDVARLVGSDHRRLEFGWRQLAAPDLRRKMIVARGGPMSWGDGDISLYLAFTEIHRSFDAVLTGDCADAVFGFPPSLQQRALEARTIAWQETNACEFWAASLRPDVRKALDLPQHRREEYERAVAEVEHLPGADALERRMREVNYLDLCWHTRVVLDRRDRIARLTGLNVRVPYCDRELVEYMYNVPWSLKTFDGREKSVLRHAVLDVIPESVAQRSKRGYPLTMDARYAAALQDQGKEILADPYSPVFAIVDQGWLEWAVQAPIPEESPSLRFGLDRALDLYHWLDLYEPELLLD